MNVLKPVLDHAVIDVRDNIDEALAVYRKLGFAPTERGFHTLGSANHLAIFATNYLELLGWERGGENVRAGLTEFPPGLNGLVFRGHDSRALYERLRANGLAVQEPLSFSRPVRFEGGAGAAAFETVRFDSGTFAGARTYFCEHFTPELVWRDEWRKHANGVLDIAAITMAANDPARVAGVFEKMFDPSFIASTGETYVLACENARIEVVPHAEIARRYGSAAPPRQDRDEYLAAIAFRADLQAAASALRTGGITPSASDGGRIVIDAADAMHVALEFVDS